jgi:flagellar basal-body rod protein FlgC
MSFYDAIAIANQGMKVQRVRLQLTASNIANASTTETPEGGAYRRRQLIVTTRDLDRPSFDTLFAGAVQPQGVRPAEIQLDPSPLPMKYEPDHPHANEQGYVAYPNVNPAIEMVDLIGASRHYEANLTVVRSSKELISQTIDLLRA